MRQLHRAFLSTIVYITRRHTLATGFNRKILCLLNKTSGNLILYLIKLYYHSCQCVYFIQLCSLLVLSGCHCCLRFKPELFSRILSLMSFLVWCLTKISVLLIDTWIQWIALISYVRLYVMCYCVFNLYGLSKDARCMSLKLTIKGYGMVWYHNISYIMVSYHSIVSHCIILYCIIANMQHFSNDKIMFFIFLKKTTLTQLVYNLNFENSLYLC